MRTASRSPALAACALLATLFTFPACTVDEDPTTAGDTDTAAPEEGPRFPCGDHGGTCDLDTEICILGGPDRCSTCVARPEACDVDATCECLPPGTDPVYEPFACTDAGTCEEVEGGLVLTCATVEWGCG